MSLPKTERARGGNRGGCGGGYERTSETYERDHLRQLRQDYLAMEARWRGVFLDGLSGFEKKVATGQIPLE